MSVQAMRILRAGHPTLRTKCRPFTVEEIRSPNTRQVVASMFKTLKESGGVGLAAPQVGIEQQVLVLKCDEIGLPNVTSFPPKVLFNPQLEYLLKHEIFRHTEMCLSVPGMAGVVTRFNNVLVHYYDEEGAKKRLAATGLLAAILQHEIDHLEGTLYIDKLETMKEFGYDEEMHHYGKMQTFDFGSIKFFDR